MTEPRKQIYEFEHFRLDIEERTLYCDHKPVQLNAKAFETLALLVQNEGRVVEKKEFMEKIWADAFVEESTLAQNIFMLRRTLGHCHDGGQYIETATRRGYRFAAKVHKVSPQDTQHLTEKLSRPRRSSEFKGRAWHSHRIDSLAVLPLSNLSDDPLAEYLSEAVAESIISNLSKLSQLRMMAHSTIAHCKGESSNHIEIGRALGVRAILVGKILKLNEVYVVRAELVDVDSGCQIWGGQCNRQGSDSLILQEEIAFEISEQLRVKLASEEQKRAGRSHADNAEAHPMYLSHEATAGPLQVEKHTEKGFDLLQTSSASEIN